MQYATTFKPYHNPNRWKTTILSNNCQLLPQAHGHCHNTNNMCPYMHSKRQSKPPNFIYLNQDPNTRILVTKETQHPITSPPYV